MKSLRACALAIGVGVVAVGVTVPAQAIDIAEVRGNAYYDADGQIMAVKHVDPPEGDRQPASFLQKYAELDIDLPVRATLTPRMTREKPGEVLMHDHQIRNQIIVKFVEGREVRLRGELLTENSTPVAAVSSLLSTYSEAVVQRAFSTSETILAENKFAAERLSGREQADLNNYYLITFPRVSSDAVDLANQLLALDIVEYAYFPSEASEPAECDDQSPATPDYEASQNYLDPAPDGVDARYAWNYHPSGSGSPLLWVADLEWGWCFEHEDLDIDAGDVLNGNTGTPRDHGTAVLGVLGSCDNGFGTTGISPNVNIKMSDFDSEPTWASNIAAATAQLFIGEVMLLEIHISGPDTGTTCPCNCIDFEYVPVEWDNACYDAIVTAVAGGLIVVEAAGNGSVNLDMAVYGGWFAPSHDSGAIMVGAAAPGAHDLMCFTDYGATVDLHGYGRDVVTTGYGDLFDQAGCAQDFTQSFSGTSSASPMITGSAAIIQSIANSKYGVDLAPAWVKAALLAGGTPQGAPTGNHIGPMPNLVWAINYIEPDLAPYTPTGWDYPIAPRAAADATGASAPLDPAALPGNGTSYHNFTTRNVFSETGTVNATETRFYVSDEWRLVVTFGPFAPLQWAWGGHAPLTIKGGRHTLRTVADATGVEAEYDEGNNMFTRQFIWTGLPLVQDVPVVRSWGPLRNPVGYGWYDVEGFEGSRDTNYWFAFAVAPTSASDDFDIRLHTEAPMNVPQQGWGAYVASSSSVGDAVDFVVVDGNHGGFGPYYGGVIAWDAANDKIVEFEEDEGILSPGVNGPFTMESSDLISLHEFSAAEGAQLRIHVQWLSGGADYRLSVFNGDDIYHSKFDVLGWADNHGPGHDEYLVMTAPNDNWYGIAVSKVASGDVPQSLSYNLIVDSVANLASFEPPDWYGPIVPRTTDDSTTEYAPLPAELIGNAPATHFNWAGINQGPVDVTTPFHYKFYVDDVFSWWYNDVTLPAGLRLIATNTVLDPVYSVVRGGRHHLRSFIDSDAAYAETLEGDNQYTDWFVWSPLPLADGVPLVRAAPPDRDPVGFGPWESNDGFRTSYDIGYWTAVATLSTAPGEEYDSTVYLASLGSKNGFGATEAYGYRIGGGTAYSLVNRNNVGLSDPVDFAAINFNDGIGELVVQRADAPNEGVFNAMPFIIDVNAIPDGSLIAMHEIFVETPMVGVPVPMTLQNISGNADLGIAWFDRAVMYADNRDAFAESNSIGDGGNEELVVTFDDDGWYGVVVYKNGLSDLGKDSTYRIHLGEITVATGEMQSIPTEFALQAARPNPFRTDATVRFDVPASGGRVTVSVFDAAGRHVRTLADGARAGGTYDVRWDGANGSGQRVRPGVYFVQLDSPAGRQSQKVVLMK